MDFKNMTVVESTGTSRRIREQYGKHKKFVRRCFLFSPSSFAKIKWW
jgi:hypothetical protein